MFAGVAGYTPPEIKAMSLYEYNCLYAGWHLSKGLGKDADGDEEGQPISEDEFERLLAAHSERSEQATRELSLGEVLAMNKDKVRHP